MQSLTIEAQRLRDGLWHGLAQPLRLPSQPRLRGEGKVTTQRSSRALLNIDDCTLTTAQSPAAEDFRQVGAEPLYPRSRAAGPSTSRRAALSAS